MMSSKMDMHLLGAHLAIAASHLWQHDKELKRHFDPLMWQVRESPECRSGDNKRKSFLSDTVQRALSRKEP